MLQTAEGKILVADESNMVVLSFTSKLVLDDIIPLHLVGASTLTMAKDGSALYVAAKDAGKIHRINLQNLNGDDFRCESLLFEGGWENCSVSSFATFQQPRGIVVADNIVYICEEKHNAVYLFAARSGEYLGKSPYISQPTHIARVDNAAYVLHKPNSLSRFSNETETVQQAVLGLRENVEWAAMIVGAG